MGLIHSKSAVKYDRSDVSFNDSSSSSGQNYADMESFMKDMGGQMKRVQHGFFNNNAKRSIYQIDSENHQRNESIRKTLTKMLLVVTDAPIVAD